jgi:hypothetical protein
LFLASSREGVIAVAKAKRSNEQVPVDRRAKDRRDDERRQENAEVVAERRKVERREKVTRRRQIDPTTCERDYSDDEVEFMNALDQYKRTSGRMFPTCSEILEVIRGLGYSKAGTLPPAIEPATIEQFI